jgi:hypothetical protein
MEAMIPEVAAVIAAAEAYVDNSGSRTELIQAVEALREQRNRPAGQTAKEEQDRTWGEVVVDDEILSVKTGRWYEVTRSVMNHETGIVKVNVKGNPNPITRPASDLVRLRRGTSGDAVDSFELLWSWVVAGK